MGRREESLCEGENLGKPRRTSANLGSSLALSRRLRRRRSKTPARPLQPPRRPPPARPPRAGRAAPAQVRGPRTCARGERLCGKERQRRGGNGGAATAGRQRCAWRRSNPRRVCVCVARPVCAPRVCLTNRCASTRARTRGPARRSRPARRAPRAAVRSRQSLLPPRQRTRSCGRWPLS